MSDVPGNMAASRVERVFDGLVARVLGRAAIMVVLGLVAFFGKQLLEDVRKQASELSNLNTNVSVLSTTITLARSARDAEVKRLADQDSDHETRLRSVERSMDRNIRR